MYVRTLARGIFSVARKSFFGDTGGKGEIWPKFVLTVSYLTRVWLSYVCKACRYWLDS